MTDDNTFLISAVVILLICVHECNLFSSVLVRVGKMGKKF